jgi:alkyldihydroxyacetonephosphate synthase
VDGLSELVARLGPGMVTTHPGELAAHARDQWALAMLQEARGAPVPPPGAVAFPATTEDVSKILTWAAETATALVPRGGGSGRSGGAQAVKRSVVVDLSRMNRVLEIDDISQTVRVQAGIRGSALETALARRGLTLGHVPASLEISTPGGWVGSAAAGMMQAGYGAIESILLGAVTVLPGGDVLTLRPVPRSAAAPSLRTMFVGSEGTLGVVTEVTLAASRAVAHGWHAFRPHSFHSGLSLLREVVQRSFRPLVARLFDESRASDLFGAFGHAGGAVLLVGSDAGAPGIEAEGFELVRLARELGARPVGTELAEHWWATRFDPVERYHAVMGPERALGDGVVADTVEVAAVWRRLPSLYDAIRGALLERAESVGGVAAHVHLSGASLLFPFVLRATDERSVERAYDETWRDVVEACNRYEGTMTYHHGVGLARASFPDAPLGPVGMRVLRSLKTSLDPRGVMNPGKLTPS